MTIDERLEALTARHEALAQSMELTHHDIQDLTTNVRKHDELIEKLLETSRSHDSQIESFSQPTISNTEHIAGLAQSHKSRIQDLEDKRQ